MSAHGHVEGIYPLTPTQTGMWMQSSIAAGIFVEQAAWCLEGPLDVEALEYAWQTVMDRHAALRSAMVFKGSEPLQVVVRHVPLRIRRESAAAENEAAALDDLLQTERQGGFKLNRPPLIRFALLRIGAERAWWIVTFHHIILDGWSMSVLWGEALAAYAARSAGGAPALPPAPDHRDFVGWLKARSGSAAERFWRASLAGFAAANPIAGRTAGGETRELSRQTSPAAGSHLARAAAACRVSPAIVLETLWAVLVAGRTRTTDVVFGATVSGRPMDVPGIERMVGCFINTVPVRLSFDGAATLRACIAAHGSRRAEQAEYEYCSTGQIHGWSGRPPGQPLYRSLLVYENLPAVAPSGGGALPLRIAGQRLDGARTELPLTLLVSPGASPHLRFAFHPQAVGEAAVGEIAAELERLLAELPQWLDRPVAAVCDSVARAPAQDGEAPPAAGREFVAPRNRLEHQLCRIWEDLFRHSPIGVLDDFFALGGHSLMALQMAAGIRSALGLELPLHLLIGEPTIERLAAALSATAAEDGALIQLAAGGAGAPVYGIHPLGGHVLCYAALAGKLRGRHPCWGLQAKGLQRGEAPAATWEEIVDHHWALLPPDAGSTPLILLGYSYGGYIAMELAARARSRGGRQISVVLLDVPHPSVLPPGMAAPSRAVLLHSLFGHVLELDLAELEALPAGELLGHVLERAVAKRVLPPGTGRETLARLLDVAHAHSRLQPPLCQYDFPALMLRARDGAERISARDDLGWRDYVPELHLSWLDGSHETMLDAQHVDAMAACLPLGGDFPVNRNALL